MAGRRAEGNVDLTGPLTTVSWDEDAFDVFIRSQGAKLVHWRAMPCPVGMSDRYDVRRTEHDHSGCSNGHIYTRAGEITCLFTQNGNKLDQHDIGLINGSTVHVTAPFTYDEEGTPGAGTERMVDVMPFDRFYLFEENILVPHRQRVEHHVSLHDRLDYQAVEVVDIIDSKNVRHGKDEYDIVDGQIVWKQSLGYDLVAKKGTIYSIRYMYRPYWYVKELQHQVRVAQVETPDGRVAKRWPQEWTMTRERVFEKEDNDELATDPDSQRQMKGPRDSAFGPR
jgi:hypothetical protein